MICYLSKNYKGLSSAGNKAKTDIEQIMDRLHYRNVGLRRTFHTNTVLSFFLTLAGVLKTPFSLRKGDILVLQYPLKKYYAFVCNLAHWRGCKVVTLIHDLGSFRRGKLTEKEEIKRLNHSDYIIAHNEVMKKWLDDRHCRAEVGALEIFDYLSSVAPKKYVQGQKPYRVLYAGALNHRKNAFLYEVGEFIHSYRFVLYGSGFECEQARGSQYFEYKGFVPSDQLIGSAEGDFGLVWDGSSASTCAGNWGEYLQYNNPHKTSLYIRCELPIIIWEKAALAGFVRQHQIGICVRSLEELDEILSNLTNEQYQDMKSNVEKVSKQLSEGHYLAAAMEKAFAFLK